MNIDWSIDLIVCLNSHSFDGVYNTINVIKISLIDWFARRVQKSLMQKAVTSQ